jgi:5,5'-dehydrodivanillate O-demethylase
MATRRAAPRPRPGAAAAAKANGAGRTHSRKEALRELVESAPGTPMGRLLRRFWQPVAISDDVAPGHAIPIRVMCEDLTLYRGRGGKPFIVDQRCPHRLTLLHTGWIEGDCIRCRYHGWKFDGGGQCVEMPAEEPGFPPKVRITSYPAADYGGIVFAWLGEGAPPPLPRKPELERDYGVKWASTQVWPCNWFQRIENSMDAVHVSFVHRETGFGEVLSYAVPALRYEETEWGIRQYATRSSNNVRISNFSFPNCNHIVVPTGRPSPDRPPHPWTDIFNWFVPVDDGHTAFYTARSAPVRGPDAERLRARLDGADRWNPADHHDEVFRGIMPGDNSGETATALVNAQDYVVQVGQGAVVDRARERLGRSDEGVIFLRRIFRRELDAIKAGRPTKSWVPKQEFSRLPVPPDVPPSPDP